MKCPQGRDEKLGGASILGVKNFIHKMKILRNGNQDLGGQMVQSGQDELASGTVTIGKLIQKRKQVIRRSSENGQMTLRFRQNLQ